MLYIPQLLAYTAVGCVLVLGAQTAMTRHDGAFLLAAFMFDIYAVVLLLTFGSFAGHIL